MPEKNTPSNSAEPLRKGDRAYYDSLTEAQLDEIWANRASMNMTEGEQGFLRSVLRQRKGFKPVEVHVSICQRCNLPADNCACLNL